MDLENLEDKSFDLSGDFIDALCSISESFEPNNLENQSNGDNSIQPLIPEITSQCMFEEQQRRQAAQQLLAQQPHPAAYVSPQQQQNTNQQHAGTQQLLLQQQQQMMSQAGYQQQRSSVAQVQNHQSAQFHQSMTQQQRILVNQQQQYQSSPSTPAVAQIQNQQPMVPRFVPQQQQQQQQSQVNQLEVQRQQQFLTANQQQYQLFQIQNQQIQLQNQQSQAQNLQTHQPASLLLQQLSQTQNFVPQHRIQQQQLQNQYQQALQLTSQAQALPSLPQQQNLQQQLQIEKPQAQLQNQQLETQNQPSQTQLLASQSQLQQQTAASQALPQQLQLQKQQTHPQNQQFQAQNRNPQVHQSVPQSSLQPSLPQQQNLQDQLQIQKQQAQARQQSASLNHSLTPEQRLQSVCQPQYQSQVQAQDLSQTSRNLVTQQQLTAKNQRPIHPKINNQQQPVTTNSSSQQRKEPYIEIIEQPASRGARFRYGCEVRENGSIPGITSKPDEKTYPTIRVVNYNGPVKIVVSCVTKDPPYYPHPHNLVGKNWCKGGVCMYIMPADQRKVSFDKLGIQCIKKKDFYSSLDKREQNRVDPFNTGFEHKHNLNTIDQSCVRLAFQAFIQKPMEKEFKIPLKPVVSNQIHDKKNSPDLTIYNVSHMTAPVTGGMSMILLCDRVAKNDIQVKFYEEQGDEVVWEGFGNLNKFGMIHKNVAILFQTPKYRNIDICKPVSLYMELLRPSDGMRSNSVQFYFTRVEEDPDQMKDSRKRKRVDDSLINLVTKKKNTEPWNDSNHSNLNIIEAR